MRWPHNKIAIAAICLGAIIFLFISVRKSEEVAWGVIGEIPPSINTDKGIDTSTYYIVRQTHEPLFRCDDLQNYTSLILKNWYRSADCKRFVFYPDTSLKFNKVERLTEEYFTDFVRSITTRYGADFNLTGTTDSVTVEFKEPQKKYLYFLTWYENAPAIRSGNIEYGLGKFYVASYTRDKIVFIRKQQVRDGYNKIVFYNYTGDDDQVLHNRKIQDFNLLSPFQQPEWIKKEYAGIKNPDPRTIVLLINHPDKETRKKLYNCLNVAQFRKAFVPKRNEFYDVKTVLPVGIPGAKPGLPDQFCQEGKTIWTGGISLINQRDDNQEPLAEYLRGFHQRTGIRIITKAIDYQDLIKIIKNPKRKPYSYNMLQIILDTFRPDHKVFFEYTSGPKSFLDITLPEVEKLFRELLLADGLDSQTKIAENLADKLGQEGMILPLYQTYSTIYYPREIKNIIVGKGFTQYPEVADFRW